MTDKDVAAHVEALLTGHPAKPFQASAEEADVLRAAVALRAGHASGVAPDPWFVENLHRELAAVGTDRSRSMRRPHRRLAKLEHPVRSDATGSGRARPRRPWWAPLGKAAAAAVIVASSVAAAVTVGHGPPVSVASAPAAVNVRSAALLASDGRQSERC